MDSISYILVRPRMYTISGTLGEVVAFIKGYVGGLSKRDPDATIVIEWVSFTEWLRHKLDVGYGDLFDTFVQHYGNDALAVIRLHEYFDEYRLVKS